MKVPPHVYFVVSAVFHYLGPAFAVLLFASVDPLGVAWLRIVSAAAVFAVWRRPWRIWRTEERKAALVALGITLAAMNALFYLAIARLPLATVGAIEFLGPIALAVVGLRGKRNVAALALAVGGVALLTQVRLTGQPIGFVFAFANCALFVAYVSLSKRMANHRGIDRLGLSMMVAAVAITPAAAGAIPAGWQALAAGAGVGICSSVIPYVCDQLALRRLPRATFALMLSLLPATATVIGLAVLGQRPSPAELAGVALVVAAVGVHREEKDGVRPAGIDGAEGLADLPGDDELRRPEVAGLAPR
jgi:inner membrane transporter RhtA